MRNRISKKDDIPTMIRKLEGQREVKERRGYAKRVRQLNFQIGMLKICTALDQLIKGESK